MNPEDESGAPPDTWDGVDCSFYYGSEPGSPERIVVDQLKYSAANKDTAWTISNLTYSTNKAKDNSVIGRLGKAFSRLKIAHPELINDCRVKFRLVSNRPVDSSVLEALKVSGSTGSTELAQKDRARLETASKLKREEFDAFVVALDLSKCGSESRFRLDEKILKQVSEWVDEDARASVGHLMRFVHQKMLPEAKGEIITRESILLQFGLSDPRGLYPCPPRIEKIERLILRDASRSVVDLMRPALKMPGTLTGAAL